MIKGDPFFRKICIMDYFMIFNILLKSLLFGMISIFIRRLIWVLGSEKTSLKEKFNASLFIEYLFFTVIYFMAFLIESWMGISDVQYLFLGILTIPLFLSFDFVIKPYYYDFFERSSVRDRQWERAILERYQKNVKVYLLKKDITNIYATGFYGSSKSILIGETLLKKIDQGHVMNLVGHELGHLDHNHLIRTYLANFCAMAIFMISAYWFYPFFSSLNGYLEGISVFCHGAFLGVLLVLIPGMVQKKFELEADSHAALLVGKEVYIATLNALNDITGGVMQKNTVNYPSLQKRIENVKNA